MKPFIVGNWKADRNTRVLNNIEYDPDIIEVALAVPDIYFDIARKNTQRYLKMCAQDCSKFDTGAYNGETPAKLLKEKGNEYLIIGHVERRKYFQEYAEVLACKIHHSIKAGLKVIYCLGETRADREEGNHMNVLYNQFFTAIGKDITVDIGYIPAYAIGTGILPSVEEIRELFKSIRKWANSINVTARILYGGSVDIHTIEEYGNIEELDGFLVATLSLTEDFSPFLKAYEVFIRSKTEKSK